MILTAPPPLMLELFQTACHAAKDLAVLVPNGNLIRIPWQLAHFRHLKPKILSSSTGSLSEIAPSTNHTTTDENDTNSLSSLFLSLEASPLPSSFSSTSTKCRRFDTTPPSTPSTFSSSIPAASSQAKPCLTSKNENSLGTLEGPRHKRARLAGDTIKGLSLFVMPTAETDFSSMISFSYA